MRLVCLSLLIITIFNCTNPSNKRKHPIDFVPENSSIILNTSNLENLKSGITNSNFLQELSSSGDFAIIEKKLSHLSHFNPSNELLICFSKDENDSLQFSVITKYNKNLFKTDSLSDYVEETLTFNNQSITKSTIKNNTFYSTIIDSVFFASSSKNITTSAFNSSNTNQELKKIYNTTSNNKTLSAILKPRNAEINTVFIGDGLSFKNFTEYLAIDVELDQNELYFNGITQVTDSTESIINIFENTVPQENQIQNVTPSNSDGFLSLTFNDYNIFEKNLKAFKKSSIHLKDSTLFNNISEIGVIYEDKNRAIVLNALDVIAAQDALVGEQSKIDTYREVDIFSFSRPKLFSDAFSPFIAFNQADTYCVLDHFFIFANNRELLQNIITNYQNETTLSQKSYFKNITKKLSSAASILQVTNSAALKTTIDKNLNNVNYKIDNNNLSALQFIYDNNFAHINGIVSKRKSRAAQNSVTEELNIKLNSDILNKPQFVKNHITGQKEIVVQDINNNLYLISNTGKILWKKQLQGSVLGKIEQIDIYKNGRLQLVFATPNRVYVLDRNGNEVKPFPLKFNDKITQPLSVFDYDKRKNYRLLVTQGKHVLMYNVKGQIVKGFTFKSANSNIISQPKHFRIGRKDYLTLKSKTRLYILDRTGRTRVTPKSQSQYSNQPLFLYNNKFTTTTINGKLFLVDANGNVSSRNMNLNENHYLETTSKTLVTLSENKISIKSKTTEMDFGNYTAPNIFYINNKIYVSTTDLQSHKIYLFDSQSKPIANFPVYGNSAIELDNVDGDSNLEFVTKGENNAILLYQIN